MVDAAGVDDDESPKKVALADLLFAEFDYDFDLDQDSEDVKAGVDELEAQTHAFDLDSQLSEAFDQMVDLNDQLTDSINFIQSMPAMFDQDDLATF